jgi:hypothetical protein
MNTNLYKSTETSITKNGVEMTPTEAASELQELSRVSYRLECDKINLTETAKQLELERDELKAHINLISDSLSDLINESTGVAGLHKNGDIAYWSDLTDGGRFEGWLPVISNQCLAEHDAEVIEQFTAGIIQCIKALDPNIGKHKNCLSISELKAFNIHARNAGVSAIKNYANQLHQKAQDESK